MVSYDAPAPSCPDKPLLIHLQANNGCSPHNCPAKETPAIISPLAMSQRRLLQETRIEGHAEQVRRVDEEAYRRLVKLLEVLKRTSPCTDGGSRGRRGHSPDSAMLYP